MNLYFKPNTFSKQILMDVSRPFLMTLILHFLTSLPLKRTLILAKSLTSDPYNRGFLKRRKSVLQGLILLDASVILPQESFSL